LQQALAKAGDSVDSTVIDGQIESLIAQLRSIQKQSSTADQAKTVKRTKTMPVSLPKKDTQDQCVRDEVLIKSAETYRACKYYD